MCDKFIKENVELHILMNVVEEYEAFLSKDLLEGDHKDITKFKSFKDLQDVVNGLNSQGVKSNGELENDYEVLVNDSQVIAVSPHTHAASRKVALKWFSFRDNEQTNEKDCPWCTTYNNDTHFNNYYDSGLKTFIYVKIKGDLKEKIVKECGKRLEYVALEISSNNNINVWDMDDSQANAKIAESYLTLLQNYMIDNNLQDNFN